MKALVGPLLIKKEERSEFMKNIGLVMEGGGMRGLYTCGVLEYFMEQNLQFPYMIGVSAGACNSLSYASWQMGRNERVILDFMSDKRYMGMSNFLKTGNYFGMDFIFDTIPNQHVPFDFDTFQKAPHQFIVGTTNIETGQPMYFGKEDIDPKFHVLRASAALPLLSKIVYFKGHALMDGGIIDAIPVAKAMADGCEKTVIILTRNKGYYKKPSKGTRLLKVSYKKYPKLIEAMAKRHEVYNATLELINQLEAEGKAFVIRPTQPLEVGRLERDPVKLKALLDQGYADAKALGAALIEFLGQAKRREEVSSE